MVFNRNGININLRILVSNYVDFTLRFFTKIPTKSFKTFLQKYLMELEKFCTGFYHLDERAIMSLG